MKLTIELEAGEIATYAHLAKILQVAKEYDLDEMGGVYPLPILLAMDALLDSFDRLLEGMDSPFVVGGDSYIYANHIAYRMQSLSETLLEMKAEMDEKQARIKKTNFQKSNLR